MSGHYDRDQIDNWVSDFLSSDAARRFDGPVVEYAQEILAQFLTAACAHRGVGPSDVEEADVRAALLGAVAGIEAPQSVRERTPELCGSFLEELEAAGRLGGGRTLGRFVRALREAFLKSSGASRAPERRVAPKISPNDPCPCGSGRKFKRCCQVTKG
jgi:hypothetical protein